MIPVAAIFDVEGTLIDSVPWQLESWRITLASAGHHFTHADLHPFSGMDGQWMLDRLLPAQAPDIKQKLLAAQGELYQKDFLTRAEPLPAIRELFEALKARGVQIGIGTTCKRHELDRYDQRLKILDLTDAVACGEMVKNGKPDPALFQTCLAKLRIADARSAVAIGDTPYDARAATQLNLRAIGVLTGGFTADALRDAGCDVVFGEVRAVEMLWREDVPD